MGSGKILKNALTIYFPLGRGIIATNGPGGRGRLVERISSRKVFVGRGAEVKETHKTWVVGKKYKKYWLPHQVWAIGRWGVYKDLRSQRSHSLRSQSAKGAVRPHSLRSQSAESDLRAKERG